MAETRLCKKKLTDAGAGACVFSLLALIAAGGAIAALVILINEGLSYISFMDTSSLVAPEEIMSFVIAFSDIILSTVLSLVVLIVSLACVKRKKLGAEFGALLTLLSFVLGAIACCETYSIYNAFGSIDDDYIVLSVLIYALPALSYVLLFICGIILWGRCATETFSVKCPIVKREKYQPIEENSRAAEQFTQTSASGSPHIEYTNSNYEQPQEQASVPVQQEMPSQSEEAVIPETVICPNCGASVRAGAKFCAKCGSGVK